MIVRLVFLPAKPEAFDRLAELYEEGSKVVRAQKGMRKLELFHDKEDPYTLVTISHWDSDEALQAYRHSEFFKEFWPKVRETLRSRATAQTLVPIERQGI